MENAGSGEKLHSTQFNYHYLSYRICVWGCCSCLIYFAPSDAYAIPLFIESKFLPVNTKKILIFDTVENLMHDIWKGLAL